MTDNVNSMAYVGEVPWHGHGTKVPPDVTAEGMIRAADLDWNVEKEPIGRAKPGTSGGRYLLKRRARPGHKPREKDVELGIVSDRYQPLQNTDAFKFFDPFIKQGVARFETAGALGTGERVWILACMPGRTIEVVPGDEVSQYLVLSNSHDGDGAVKIKFTPIRVVCQNTLNLALKNGDKAFSIQHSRTSMPLRLDEVSTMIGMFQGVFDDAAVAFRAMVKTNMNEDRLTTYLESVLPRTDSQRESQIMPKRWKRIMNAFKLGQPTGHVRGTENTLWAAYNAVTYDEDYRPPTAAVSSNSRLNRVWFGDGADLKLAALQKGIELAAAWR